MDADPAGQVASVGFADDRRQGHVLIQQPSMTRQGGGFRYAFGSIGFGKQTLAVQVVVLD